MVAHGNEEAVAEVGDDDAFGSFEERAVPDGLEVDGFAGGVGAGAALVPGEADGVAPVIGGYVEPAGEG